MTTIRLATEKDVPRIVELYHELTIAVSHVEQVANPSAEDYRRVFQEICADPRHELFVAEDGGRIVGTVILIVVPNLSHSATPWALVENLVVTSGHRRRGTGKMLLEHVIARAREKGCHRIELCSDKRREKAHRLYRSVGFEQSAHGFRIWF
ncbi:MAG: GNAT family N-acetyltransferase [Chloroflexi bacterium]|nr:GNAT family N-acetyltransferase [Chloroflexota bacterium]